jgi:hypothetical protein
MAFIGDVPEELRKNNDRAKEDEEISSSAANHQLRNAIQRDTRLWHATSRGRMMMQE